MELIQRNASRDEGYHGQAPRGSIGGWNPEGKSSIDLVAQFVGTADVILSRAQRAHSRLSWTRRLARNARPETAGPVTIKLFGVPAAFATSLGLVTG